MNVAADNSNVTQLPTDVALAIQARNELAPIMQALCDVMNKYRAMGLIINVNCPLNAYGRHAPQPVDVLRPL